MKTKKRIVSLILILAIVLGAIPAYAVEASSEIPDEISVAAANAASEFDFSDVDALNKYDQYEKRTREDGLEYVHMAAKNSIGGPEPEPIDRSRYGAFLRNSAEKQYFLFYNLKFSTYNIDQNVLTVYADPEVNFVVENESGIEVVNNSGFYVPGEVDYFKASYDNGHRVYYIEFVPRDTDECDYMIEFSTNSTTTQPHYSVWFGSPLVLRKTVSIGNAFLTVKYPNTSATNTFSGSAYFPTKSWISKVLITNVSRSGADKVSAPDIYVEYPGGQKSLKYSAKIYDEYLFNYNPSDVKAIPARGTYKLHLNTKWSALSSGATFRFQGNVSVEYLYPLGG